MVNSILCGSSDGEKRNCDKITTKKNTSLLEATSQENGFNIEEMQMECSKIFSLFQHKRDLHEN